MCYNRWEYDIVIKKGLNITNNNVNEEKIIQYGFYYMKCLCYSIRTSNERKGKYNHEYI